MKKIVIYVSILQNNEGGRYGRQSVKVIQSFYINFLHNEKKKVKSLKLKFDYV